jgi:uracil-DNA glycosylase
MNHDTTAWGRFPFGQPNRMRPPRYAAAGRAKLLVVGVYPSAFHVAWSPPPPVDPRPEASRRRALISSFAVDVEPVVFWDGNDPAPGDLLNQWKADVGFIENQHGSVAVGRNGPSGAGLVRDVLEPMHVDVSTVAFTDVVPWFYIKHGKGSQGDATATRFAPIAEVIGVHAGSLPTRPTRRQLVGVAASERRRESLRAEIVDIDPELLVTLGQEALDAIAAVADDAAGVQTTLRPDGYGAVGHVTINGRNLSWLPLVHPGFRRQASDAEWKRAFEEWSVPRI